MKGPTGAKDIQKKILLISITLIKKIIFLLLLIFNNGNFYLGRIHKYKY